MGEFVFSWLKVREPRIKEIGMDQVKASVSEIIGKLESVRLERPKGAGYTGQFLKLLASEFEPRSNPLITAEEWLLVVELTFGKVERLAEGARECHAVAPDEVKLWQMYDLDRISVVSMFIRMDLPEVCRMVMPADFAAEVGRVLVEVREEARRHNSGQ
jgi:hypothetical protein